MNRLKNVKNQWFHLFICSFLYLYYILSICYAYFTNSFSFHFSSSYIFCPVQTAMRRGNDPSRKATHATDSPSARDRSPSHPSGNYTYPMPPRCKSIHTTCFEIINWLIIIYKMPISAKWKNEKMKCYVSAQLTTRQNEKMKKWNALFL